MSGASSATARSEPIARRCVSEVIPLILPIRRQARHRNTGHRLRVLHHVGQPGWRTVHSGSGLSGNGPSPLNSGRYSSMSPPVVHPCSCAAVRRDISARARSKSGADSSSPGSPSPVANAQAGLRSKTGAR